MAKKYAVVADIEAQARTLTKTESKMPMAQKKGVKKLLKSVKHQDRKPVEIYTILACEKLEEDITKIGKPNGFSNYGCSHIAGFYTDFNDCVSALHRNTCDIWETCYNYACIEKVEEGICQPGILLGWYKYDRERNGYFHIDTPAFEKHTCGRTIG